MTGVKRIVRLLFLRDGVDRALAEILWQKWKTKTMRIVFSRMENPETTETGRLLLGVAIARNENLDSACHAFVGLPDEALVRYALPEAAAALASSDPNRALTLLRIAREAQKGQSILKKWTRVSFRLSPDRRLSLATTSAYLGDAEGVAFFTVGLRHPGTDGLKRRFAAQYRTARHLGVRTDYLSVREAALSVAPTGVQQTATTVGRAKLVETLDPDFPLAAVTEGPVWLLVRGSCGNLAQPGYFSTRVRWQGPVDFPFPGNVRPLFLEYHIADPEILDDVSLAYLQRFAPIGCRDLLTARLLLGEGVDAFIGESELPKAVSAAVLEGQSEAKVRALWREATAPAMARTNELIAEVNAKHSLPDVRVAELKLDQVPVRSFGPKTETKADNDIVQLLFNFDDNQAKFFPGAFEGVWRHATRSLVVHVFGRGLTPTMFEGWTTQFPDVRFVWHDLSNVTLGNTRLEDHITVSSWDRLLAPALLPDVEKIVYLDVDILVRKDISELFDLELGDAPLAARSNQSKALGTGAMQMHRYDDNNCFTEEQREALRNAFFSGETVFEGFNAGVLVMNLAKMRYERAVEKTLAIVRASGVGDQMALNLYARGRRKPLADEWNAFPYQELLEDPALVHFIGPIKPWHDMPFQFRLEWQENVRRVASR